MNAISGIGKYLFGFAFIIFGFIHLLNAQALTTTIQPPGGVVFIYITGLAMLLAGVAVLIGRKDAVATFLLGLLLLTYTLMVYFPIVVQSGGTDTNATSNLLKDLALAGSLFIYSRSAAKDRTTRLT